jgi:hypothetical protein
MDTKVNIFKGIYNLYFPLGVVKRFKKCFSTTVFFVANAENDNNLGNSIETTYLY